MQSEKRILTLRLKAEYWRAIQAGVKTIEYRNDTPYWRARLVGKEFDEIHLIHGYPPKDQAAEHTLIRPWKGFTRQLVPEAPFEPSIRKFCIPVN